MRLLTFDHSVSVRHSDFRPENENVHTRATPRFSSSTRKNVAFGLVCASLDDVLMSKAFEFASQRSRIFRQFADSSREGEPKVQNVRDANSPTVVRSEPQKLLHAAQSLLSPEQFSEFDDLDLCRDIDL
jgi:hypothetical protein